MKKFIILEKESKTFSFMTRKKKSLKLESGIFGMSWKMK
jgi:hypothetical protein